MISWISNKTEGADQLHELLKIYANGFIDKVGFYSHKAFDTGDIFENDQNGVIRVNCIDWLDRTNYAMTFIAACGLYRQLLDFIEDPKPQCESPEQVEESKEDSNGDRSPPKKKAAKLSEVDVQFMSDNLDKVNRWWRGSLMVDLSKIYSANGDHISKQYCGSKAMHGTSMSMDQNGEIKVDKRKENASIFMKRYLNSVLSKDMKKQSALWLINGHYKFEKIWVHPWKINFSQTDVNFDSSMDAIESFNFDQIFSLNSESAREIELDEMFSKFW